MTKQTRAIAPETNSTTTISIPQLRAVLNGRMIMPEDPTYDEARSVFYGGFDRRPALIVRVADANDVSRVVSLARESGLELAVRSGGLGLQSEVVTTFATGAVGAEVRALRRLGTRWQLVSPSARQEATRGWISIPDPPFG